MRVKFEATDATGKVHKRSSVSHVYSHCVLIHFAAHPPSEFWPKGVASCSQAEWVGKSSLLGLDDFLTALALSPILRAAHPAVSLRTHPLKHLGHASGYALPGSHPELAHWGEGVTAFKSAELASSRAL
jgi:hypothetical protein